MTVARAVGTIDVLDLFQTARYGFDADPADLAKHCRSPCALMGSVTSTEPNSVLKSTIRSITPLQNTMAPKAAPNLCYNLKNCRYTFKFFDIC